MRKLQYKNINTRHTSLETIIDQKRKYIKFNIVCNYILIYLGFEIKH